MQRIVGIVLFVSLALTLSGCAGMPAGQGQNIMSALGKGIGALIGNPEAGAALGRFAGAAIDASNGNPAPVRPPAVVVAAPLMVAAPVIYEGPSEVGIPPVIYGEPCYYAPPIVFGERFDWWEYRRNGA